MDYFKSRVFLFTVLLQVAGPFLFTFSNWANVIQYISGFGMSYAFFKFEKHIEFLHRAHGKVDEQCNQ